MPASPRIRAYRNDLAYVHDQGFLRLAQAAADAVMRDLEQRRVERAHVVDLGCGSGATAAQLAAAGHRVLGVDRSAAMLALARKRAPRATFRRGSVLDASLPECDVVCAIGEVLSYRFDARMGAPALGRLFRRVHAALRPGGLLLFDIANTHGQPNGSGAWKGKGWSVQVEFETDVRRRERTRRMTTSRRVGSSWRRSSEVHVQRLYEPTEIEARLRQVGFRVRRSRLYGELVLPRGLTAFLARKH